MPCYNSNCHILYVVASAPREATSLLKRDIASTGEHRLAKTWFD